MLKRTKSEAKPRSSSSSEAGAESTTGGSGAAVEGGKGAGEKGAKKEKSKFRLSIKKKTTRSPVLEECSDEFVSLSLPAGKTESSPLADLSPPSQFQCLLQSGGDGEGGEGDVFEGRTEYLSRSLDRKRLPNGHGAGVVAGGEGGGERGGEEEEDRGNQSPAEKMVGTLQPQHL